jgi:hypothetical protein
MHSTANERSVRCLARVFCWPLGESLLPTTRESIPHKVSGVFILYTPETEEYPEVDLTISASIPLQINTEFFFFIIKFI